METELWELVDTYTQTRWWFGWPILVVMACLALAFLLAVVRLHRRSLLAALVTATAVGGAAALLLPGLWLAWQPLTALGVDIGALPRTPTATFPAIAYVYDRAFMFACLGCAALVLGAFGTFEPARERRFDACATCGRERHPSWNGVCPECRLLELRPDDATLLQLGSMARDPHAITQFGTPAHTELLEGAAGHTAWLEVVEGPSNVGERFAIGGRIAIGRDPQQCRCLLDDEAISGRHAAVAYDRQRFVLSDSGSRNGIRVNGQPVTQHMLHHGDMIAMGHSVLRFIAPEQAAKDTPTVLLDASDWRARLVALNGSAARTVFPIRQLDVQIGRGTHNNINLEATTVSRQHARVRFDGSGYQLVDLGSPNGVWLNGTRVLGTALLRHGQEIVLGDQQLRFEMEEPAHAGKT